ncbi:MAG: acylneuraminate cytidylyltransferase family protein [Bacteroidota bacterium]
MKILGLIPARGGSKGVPRKNIRLLGNRPLLAWTVTAAREASSLDRLIVSTDDAEIARVAEAAGAEVPFLRPAALADDGAKSIDVVLHALEVLPESYDAVCLLQPTTPFRSVNLLRKALNTFRTGNYSGLITVSRVPAHYHPNWAFVDGGDGHLTPAQGVGSVIPRRQELPPAFIRDGAVYLTRTETLRAGSFFGDHLGYVENTDPRQVNIDTLEDWQRAEQLLHGDD